MNQQGRSLSLPAAKGSAVRLWIAHAFTMYLSTVLVFFMFPVLILVSRIGRVSAIRNASNDAGERIIYGLGGLSSSAALRMCPVNGHVLKPARPDLCHGSGRGGASKRDSKLAQIR